MNIQRTIHNVQQGTPAWLALRAGYFTASEAPAMMGVSKYTSRTELLRQKATGVAEEVGAAKQALFDKGHAAEASARPIAEGMVGGELYPVTATIEVDGLRLLASLDGQTMEETIIWETKLWNEELAADVRAGALHPHYTVQMDQELLVSGAERCLFTCSDGTPERTVSCWYESSQEKFEALIAGWLQFVRELLGYVSPEPAPAAPVGKAPETLPALRIEITGAVTASNLAEFKATALAAIRAVNRDLTTDQDFADADKAVKWCADVEDRLKAAKEHALSQTATIDALFKTIDDISAEARAVRLEVNKLVDKRKSEIKDDIILKARTAYLTHVAELDDEIHPLRLALAIPDFAGAAKNRRTVATLQDAVDTALAGAKIAADALARDWRAKLAWHGEEAADHLFLFHDLQQLIAKPVEDFKLAVTARIEAHKKAEADKKQREEDAKRIADQALQTAAAPAPVVQPVAQVAAVVARRAPAASELPTLKLGVICERLGFVMTAAFVAETLGVQHAATDKSAKLFTESQFSAICAALVSHVMAMDELYAGA